MKRLTFQYPECGDCSKSLLLSHYPILTITPVIMALVTASGTLGLNAFFPPKETTITAPELGPGDAYPKYLPPPHLPLTPTWHEADYSLPNILSTTALPGEQVDIRQYCMRLLSRYLYLDGESPNVSKTLACFQFCNAKKKKKKKRGTDQKIWF